WRTSSPTRTTGAGPRAGGGQGTSPCGPGAEFVRPCRARAGPGTNSAQPHELGHDGGPVRSAGPPGRPGCWFQDLRHPRRPTAQASDPGESRAVAGAVTRSGAHRPRRRHVRPRDGDPARAPSHRSRRTTMNARRSTIVTATAVGAMLLMSACGGCGGSDAELGTEENPVQLGVVSASEPYWAVYEEAVEAEGIAIDIIDFTDYNQPNPALSEGELDVNQFQHIIFLANYNVQAGDDLVPIGSTAIYPLGLYSTQYDSVEDIPDGAE